MISLLQKLSSFRPVDSGRGDFVHLCLFRAEETNRKLYTQAEEAKGGKDGLDKIAHLLGLAKIEPYKHTHSSNIVIFNFCGPIYYKLVMYLRMAIAPQY